MKLSITGAVTDEAGNIWFLAGSNDAFGLIDSLDLKACGLSEKNTISKSYNDEIFRHREIREPDDSTDRPA